MSGPFKSPPGMAAFVAEDDFHDPHVGISRVYTRKGDQGETSLVGGQRVGKDEARIAAYGDVDELMAVVGLCREEAQAAGGPVADLDPVLDKVQHGLFNLGSVLATLPDDLHAKQPRVRPRDVEALEAEIDARNGDLPPLRSFVLPGGSRLNALLHLARTVCRRAERGVVALRRAGGCSDVEVAYLNRLSDAFFVWSRWAAVRLDHDEVLWDPNRA